MLRGRKSGRVHPYIFEDLRLEDSGEDKDSSNEVEVEIDEETVIKYYFQCGFSYEEIIHFLAKRHDHEISNTFKAIKDIWTYRSSFLRRMILVRF